MKRKFTVIPLALLLISTYAGLSIIDSTTANPFSQSAYSGEKYGVNAKPPAVTILSPESGKVYTTRNITLNLNVSTRESKTAQGGFRMTTAIGIDKLSYVADWQLNTTLVFHSPDMEDIRNNVTSWYYLGQYYDIYDNNDDLPEINFENLSLPLTNVPDGNHTLYVIAQGVGEDYYIFNWYIFHVTGMATTQFTVKATPPKISLLPFEETAYTASGIPLNFLIDEPNSQISYSLDGQGNVTISGNTTLRGLFKGLHNITAFATDNSGNIGVSETLHFSVEATEFTSSLLIAGAVAASVIAASVAVYLKKRKPTDNAMATRSN